MKNKFSTPYITGNEIIYIQNAIENKLLSGNGPFTKKCIDYLTNITNSKKILLTSSCTDALEMTAILSELKDGDEVIMPSYTFVSTANAFVLRGVTPVFVDVDPITFNIDFNETKKAITSKTKAIVLVHYAGVSCDIDLFKELADENNLLLIEDAAQGLLSTYKNLPLGSIGDMATISFHETKNIVCGEGGALLVNNEKFYDRAEIIWEKGTDRSKFFRGEIDKYGWVDIGSSYLPSEIQAAFLYAQLEKAKFITDRRKLLWDRYYHRLKLIKKKGDFNLPSIPEFCQQNYHLFYIVFNSANRRNFCMEKLNKQNIKAIFHYIPLHNSTAGLKYGRYVGELNNTIKISENIMRLPLHPNLSLTDVDQICDQIELSLKK